MDRRRRLKTCRKSIPDQADASFSLAKRVISTHAKRANFVFSPLSLQIVLAMTASGSNPPTRDQLLGFLQSKSTEELSYKYSQVATVVLADGEPLGGPRLSFANGVWVDRRVGLKDSFKQIIEKHYMAASALVDFPNKADEIINEVNAWAEKETNGLIKQILPPDSVDASTMFILANAVYFGDWWQKFDKSQTKDHDFFPLKGKSFKAPFMTSYKTQYQYVRAFKGFKVLGLPYEQGDDTRKFTMLIFLPNAKDGLKSLIKKIVSKPGFVRRHLPKRHVEVGVFRIPKFKIGFDFEASEVLKAEGVVLPFVEGGLSEMVDNSSVGSSLCVSRMFHKAFIEVNEGGTEAAAVSVAEACLSCSLQMPPPPDFVADHPFVFVIREDMSGVVLFIGQLLNPLEGGSLM